MKYLIRQMGSKISHKMLLVFQHFSDAENGPHPHVLFQMEVCLFGNSNAAIIHLLSDP